MQLCGSRGSESVIITTKTGQEQGRQGTGIVAQSSHAETTDTNTNTRERKRGKKEGAQES